MRNYGARDLLIFGLGLLVASCQAHAQADLPADLQIPVRADGNQLILRASSIASGSESIRAIRTWTQKYLHFKSSAPSLDRTHFKKVDQNFEIEFSELLPPAIRSIVDHSALCNGPNCFDMAIFATGLMSAVRYVAPEEISFLDPLPPCFQNIIQVRESVFMFKIKRSLFKC